LPKQFLDFIYLTSHAAPRGYLLQSNKVVPFEWRDCVEEKRLVNLKRLCPHCTFLKVNICYSTAEIQNGKLANTCFHLQFQHLRDLFKGTFGTGLANVMGNHNIIDAFKMTGHLWALRATWSMSSSA